jgi:hypothetical protein
MKYIRPQSSARNRKILLSSVRSLDGLQVAEDREQQSMMQSVKAYKFERTKFTSNTAKVSGELKKLSGVHSPKLVKRGTAFWFVYLLGRNKFILAESEVKNRVI